MKIVFILFFLLASFSITFQEGLNKSSQLGINQKIGYFVSDNGEKDYYLFNSIEYEIEKKNNFYLMHGVNIPSDLIDFFTHDNKEKSFEILINQGRLSQEFKRDHFNKINNQKENYFFDDNVLIDYPSGYLFHSNNFSTDNFSNFKNFFDIFSMTFKITLNPLLDRSSYIKEKKNDEEVNYYLFDDYERACTDHIDGIKETLPPKKWKEYMKKINYTKFSHSDYKTIKYFFKYSPKENKIIFSYRIIYKIEKSEINKDIEFFELGSKNHKTFEKSDVSLKSSRYFQGEMFNFENFIYTNELALQLSGNNSISSHIKVIDVIPNQLNIILSSIKVELNANDFIFYFDHKNLNHILDIELVESIENQHPSVPFTYESKKMTKICFKIKESFIIDYLSGLQNINNDITLSLKISYELRKRLLNFESYDNLQEFGYKYPCGLIIYNDIPYVTNHIYFNIPNVDETMPFNVISLTWVIYGFILIQVLNLFISGGKSGKSLWQTIRDRFMAKWGFLFGR